MFNSSERNADLFWNYKRLFYVHIYYMVHYDRSVMKSERLHFSCVLKL